MCEERDSADCGAVEIEPRSLRFATAGCAAAPVGMTAYVQTLTGGECVVGPAQVLEGGGYASEGKADYVEVAPFDARDVASGATLDGVGAGFVERLAGGKIGGNFFAGERMEMDQRGFDEFDVRGVRKTDERDASQDGVRAARELFEHVASVIGRTGLAQDFAVQGDSGIGGDDDGGAYGTCGDQFGFSVGEAQHHVIR